MTADPKEDAALDAWIEEQVAKAPPLGEEQLNTILSLMGLGPLVAQEG
ncbi:hypothetical protein [Streptomyces sp. NPDC002386]